MNIIEPSYSIERLDDGLEILQRIEKIGRVSHKSEDRITSGSALEFAQMLLRIGHHSVFEHEYMLVRFICDRGVTHELVRHRLAAYTQESTRYCNYSKGKFGGEITVIRLCFLNSLTPSYNYDNWKKACLAAEENYMHLLECGAKPEEARSVLPNSLKTEIVATANLREWRHIFTLRTAKAAHPQMRQLMVPLLKEVQDRVPVIFAGILCG